MSKKIQKVKKKKRGFTLIELLAVIVILAVIALIVTPLVTGIIGNAKKSADERSAEGYVKGADDYFARSQINETMKQNLNKNIIDKVETAGGNATGTLVVSDKGKVAMSIIINNRCYTKNSESAEILIDDNIVYCGHAGIIPPDSCFATTDVSGGIDITGYNCGSTYVSNVYNNDGTYTYIEIPSVINGKTVKGISNYAFSPRKADGNYDPTKTIGISYVSIPGTVKTVGFGAFWDNQLEGTTLNDGIQILDQHSLEHNKLTSIKIPGSVTTIAHDVFEADQLTSIEIPEGVTTIGTLAFYNNKLTSATIPNSVTSIAADIFQTNPNLTTIKVDKTNGSLAGAPWGAPSTAVVSWLR